jgi:XTP/dITP diphosphohydrolase
LTPTRSLLIATTNAGKVREISELLADLPFLVLSLIDLTESYPAPKETGETYAENALLKADYYQSRTGMLTLADDSGLSVEALNGAPGVYSARYAGEGASSAMMVAKLLKALEDVPVTERSAHFTCAVAIVGDGVREVFEGRCDGMIAMAPQGEGGFGYDPVFIDPQSGQTFAELSSEEKATRSHRGLALRRVREYLLASNW